MNNKNMIFKTAFRRKENQLETDMCSIVKVIELPKWKYENFCKNLLGDYDFIKDNKDVMGTDNSKVAHCILVLGEGYDDGIVIDSEGYNYARYTSHLPNARLLLALNQYPSLVEFNKEMNRLADKYVKKALDCQRDCQYRISYDDVRVDCKYEHFNEDLFIEMLSNRGEIEYAEPIDDEIIVSIAPDYVLNEDESNYRRLTQEEVNVICAKHILWLHDAGGEQADFSSCLLRNINLSKANLMYAIFDNAKIVDTNMYGAELCFAAFNNTRLVNCDCTDITAEEAVLKSAEFVSCEFGRACFTHSNFSDSNFCDCSLTNSSLENCCVDGTAFNDTKLSSVNMNGCSYDEQEWSQKTNEMTLSM